MTKDKLIDDLRYLRRLLAEGDVPEAKRQLQFLIENLHIEGIEIGKD